MKKKKDCENEQVTSTLADIIADLNAMEDNEFIIEVSFADGGSKDE